MGAVRPRPRGWLEVAERGSALGLWSVVALTTLVGRTPTRALLRPLAAYYALAAAPARRASRAYLERIHGRPARADEVYRHLLAFAECTLDRLFFVRGEVDLFEVVSEGEEHLRELLASGRGAILLGAHLGSFEAMLRMAEARSLRVNIVGYFRNARLLNGVLERLRPGAMARLVELDPEGVEFVLRIRDLLEAGELVAILADRLGPGSARFATVEFLGAPARFPTGPFELAAALGCPVALVFGLRRGGPSRYELHCEPFAERVVLPRRGRQEALRAEVARFAARLEHYCRLAPDNWFNFFDFWQDEEAGPPAPAKGPVKAGAAEPVEGAVTSRS